ncbi:MAG: ATP-binding protein [Fidelibacterota bacterium]
MYEIEKSSDHIKIKASASYILMEKMCVEVEKFSKEKNFDDKEFALLLCVREALTNAIRHGCKNDMSNTIEFSLTYDNNTMYIQVTDDGDGFDWEQESNNTVYTLTTNGRGLNIIKIYSEEYQFNENGNKINITVKND